MTQMESAKGMRDGLKCFQQVTRFHTQGMKEVSSLTTEGSCLTRHVGPK